MPHPFDASTKYLVQIRLADWLPLCGRATMARVEIIDADLATVTAAADRVLRIHEDPPWLLHLELQASRDPDFIRNLYNGLLERQHGLRVRTVAVLLRRSADAPELLKGVHGMKESVTYQAIVEEGEVKARQEVLLELGNKRFGPPNKDTEMAIRGITNLERLKQLNDRLLDVSNWQVLLGSGHE